MNPRNSSCSCDKIIPSAVYLRGCESSTRCLNSEKKHMTWCFISALYNIPLFIRFFLLWDTKFRFEAPREMIPYLTRLVLKRNPQIHDFEHTLYASEMHSHHSEPRTLTKSGHILSLSLNTDDGFRLLLYHANWLQVSNDYLLKEKQRQVRTFLIQSWSS